MTTDQTITQLTDEIRDKWTAEINENCNLKLRLLEAVGLLKRLKMDEGNWPTHSDCDCADCALYRDVTALLNRQEGEPRPEEK